VEIVEPEVLLAVLRGELAVPPQERVDVGGEELPGETILNEPPPIIEDLPFQSCW
jgi:hypothetical protein